MQILSHTHSSYLSTPITPYIMGQREKYICGQQHNLQIQTFSVVECSQILEVSLESKTRRSKQTMKR